MVPFRDALLRVSLSLASLCFAFIVVDVALRLVGYDQRKTVTTTGSHKILNPMPGIRYLYPSYSQFQQTWPSDDRNYFGSENNTLVYQLNNFGFRDNDFLIRRSERVRIAVLGDSFAFGMGVKPGDVFTSLLERDLNLTGNSGLEFEVYNFALPGIGTEHESALYRHVVRHFKPDILIVWYVLNDVNCPPNTFVEWTAGKHLPSLRQHWLFLDFAIGTVESLLAHRATVQGITKSHRPGHPGYESVKNGLQGIAEIAASEGTSTFLFIHPWLYTDADGGYPFTDAHQAIEKLAISSGFEFIDLTPWFAGHNMSTLHVHACDQHPNEKAHQIAAAAVLTTLRKNFKTKKPSNRNWSLKNPANSVDNPNFSVGEYWHKSFAGYIDKPLEAR